MSATSGPTGERRDDRDERKEGRYERRDDRDERKEGRYERREGRYERRDEPQSVRSRLRAKARKKARKQRKKGFVRRKVCRFCADSSLKIDYRDPRSLRLFITETGKMIPRRISGNCARHQRPLAVAIKRARHLALLPTSSQYL
jgi:small subunit ribosomal protein S18